MKDKILLKNYLRPVTEVVKIGGGEVLGDFKLGSEGGDPWGEGAAKRNNFPDGEEEKDDNFNYNVWTQWAE